MRRWDWSETSQTAVVFSREHGVLRVLAKGSKRERGAFSGGLELTHRAHFQAISKPAAGLLQLTSWDLAEVFPGVTRTAGAFYAASFALGAVEQAVRDHDPHPRLYAELASFLRAGVSEIGAIGSLRFLWVLLDEAGYRPRLAAEGEGEADDPGADASGVVEFGPHEGRVLGAGERGAGPVWRVRRSTVRLLAELARAVGEDEGGAGGAGLGVMGPGALGPGSVGSGGSGGETAQRAGRLLASYLREILGRELAAWDRFVGEPGGGGGV